MGSLISAAQLVIEEEGRERESFERREILFFRHAGNPVRKRGGRLGVSRSRAGRVPPPRSLAHASVYRGARLLRFRHLGLSRWVDGGSAGERARRSRRAESRAVSLGSQLDKITNGALDSDECREERRVRRPARCANESRGVQQAGGCGYRFTNRETRENQGKNRSRTHVVLVVVVIVYVTCGLDRRFLARRVGLVVSCWRHGRRYFFGFVEREGRRYTLWVLSDRFKGRKLADATATPRSPAPVNRTRFSPTLYCQEKAPGQRGLSRESSPFFSGTTGYLSLGSEAVLMKSGVGEILVREVVNFANHGFFPRAVGMAQCRFALLRVPFQNAASESP